MKNILRYMILIIIAILLFVGYNKYNKSITAETKSHAIVVNTEQCHTIDDRNYKLPIGAKILKVYKTNNGSPYILWTIDNDCFMSTIQTTYNMYTIMTTAPSKNCIDSMQVLKTIQ